MGKTYHRETLLVYLARELEVYTSEDGAHLSVNLHRAGDFGDDIDEMAGLECGVGLGRFGVAVLPISLASDGELASGLTMASHCHTTTWSVALTASIWPGRCLSTLSAPYRPMMITFPGILSGLTTYISHCQTEILTIKDPD